MYDKAGTMHDRDGDAHAGKRIKTIKELQKYSQSAQGKHLWEKGGRNFLSVMANALYDNKTKTAWKLGISSAIKVMKMM